jgi:hypothetical protein
VKMAEILKGNADFVQGMSLQGVLESHITTFTRSCTPHRPSSEDAPESGGNGKGNCMKRGGPPLPSSRPKKRLASKNEVMLNCTKAKPCCSLCKRPRHRANGTRCPVSARYNSYLVQWTDVRAMAAKLGDPFFYEVRQSDEETTQLMNQWVLDGNSKDIPKDAWHLILINTYFGPIPNESSQRNIIEVTILAEGGRELSGYEKAFFPVHRIHNWMIKHCTMRHQKKHVLSTLRCGTAMKRGAKDHIDS